MMRAEECLRDLAHSVERKEPNLLILNDVFGAADNPPVDLDSRVEFRPGGEVKVGVFATSPVGRLSAQAMENWKNANRKRRCVFYGNILQCNEWARIDDSASCGKYKEVVQSLVSKVQRRVIATALFKDIDDFQQHKMKKNK